MTNEEKMLDLLTRMQTDISSLKSGQEEMQRVCSLARERNDGIRKYDILQEEIERKKKKWDEASGRFESRRKKSRQRWLMRPGHCLRGRHSTWMRWRMKMADGSTV